MDAFSLTGVPVIYHEKIPLLSIISVELQLQHVWVVLHAAPLDVYWRLLLSATLRVLGWPVHLVQSSLCGRKSSPRNYYDIIIRVSAVKLHVPLFVSVEPVPRCR